MAALSSLIANNSAWMPLIGSNAVNPISSAWSGTYYTGEHEYLPPGDLDEDRRYLLGRLQVGVYEGLKRAPLVFQVFGNGRSARWQCIIVGRSMRHSLWWRNEIDRLLASHSFLGGRSMLETATDGFEASRGLRGVQLQPQDQLVMVRGWSEGPYADEVMSLLQRAGLNAETDYACVG